MQVEKNICSKGPFIIDINQEGGEERGSLGMGREVVKEKIASTEKTKTNKKQLKKKFLSTRKNINLIACIVCLIIRWGQKKITLRGEKIAKEKNAEEKNTELKSANIDQIRIL